MKLTIDKPQNQTPPQQSLRLTMNSMMPLRKRATKMKMRQNIYLLKQIKI